jgi:hypothetical protein
MSKIANGIAGVVAGALVLGAVQLEHARSGTLPAGLAGLPQGDASVRSFHDVDRAGKADRLGARVFEEATATMFVYPVTMPDTLIAARVIRKPATPARKAPAAKSNAEMKIGCEPLISVLAAEAENLQPGRCVV